MRLVSLFLAATTVGAFAPLSQLSVRTTPASTIAYAPVAPVVTASSSQLAASVLTPTELPDKLYIKKGREGPKIFGGLKIGLRDLVVVTGASSGLGLNTAATLAKTGRYFVVMAVRDVEKAKRGTLLLFRFEASFSDSCRRFVWNLNSHWYPPPPTFLFVL